MIIYGTRSKVIKNNDNLPRRFNCNHCKSDNTVNVIHTFNYFHIFWIPMFPYSKKIMTECSHCKNLLYQNEISPVEVNNIKATSTTKIPWGYYFGLILIGLFIIFVASVIATGH